jgi:hypothetical protein
LQKASTPRRLCCDSAVPIEPGDVPMMAQGLPVNAFWPHGRLAQSMAFLRPPGIERLYSSVTNNIASASAIFCLKSRATGG